MTTRPCPHCGERIQNAAVLCRFCRRQVPKRPDASPILLFAGGALLLVGVVAAVGVVVHRSRGPSTVAHVEKAVEPAPRQTPIVASVAADLQKCLQAGNVCSDPKRAALSRCVTKLQDRIGELCHATATVGADGKQGPGRVGRIDVCEGMSAPLPCCDELTAIMKDSCEEVVAQTNPAAKQSSESPLEKQVRQFEQLPTDSPSNTATERATRIALESALKRAKKDQREALAALQRRWAVRALRPAIEHTSKRATISLACDARGASDSHHVTCDPPDFTTLLIHDYWCDSDDPAKAAELIATIDAVMPVEKLGFERVVCVGETGLHPEKSAKVFDLAQATWRQQDITSAFAETAQTVTTNGQPNTF
jgi:hypothetical protein